MTPEERIVRELWPNVRMSKEELETLVSHDVNVFRLASTQLENPVEDAARAAYALIQESGYTATDTMKRLKRVTQSFVKAI